MKYIPFTDHRSLFTALETAKHAKTAKRFQEQVNYNAALSRRFQRSAEADGWTESWLLFTRVTNV